MNQLVLPRPGNEEHMLGHGFYNKHSHEQGKANTYALPLISESINQIDLRQVGSEFRIADYGSAQGQNSLLPMKAAIAQLKTLVANYGKTEIPITVTHADLPTNNWTTLFKLFYLHPTAIWWIKTTCFASRVALPFSARFFPRTTSRLAILPSPNIG